MMEFINNFLSNLSIICFSYISFSAFKTYKCYKDFKAKPDISIKLPPKLVSDNQTIGKEQLNIYIQEFDKIIQEKIPKENLILYNKNKSDCNIYDLSLDNILLRKMRIKCGFGLYFTKYNNILLMFAKGKETKTIAKHELFHMASSYYDKENKIKYSGFYQTDLYKKINFCRGLNEGYTEVLTERYFENGIQKQEGTFIYLFCRNVASLFEKIIGQEKMENLYMNANLKDLFFEAEKYNEKEQFLNFNHNMDYLYKYSLEKIKGMFIPNFYLKKIEPIQKYLLDTYVNKKFIELENQQINYDILINDISKFINEVYEIAIIKQKNYNTLTKEDFLDYINSKIQNNQEVKFK